MLSRMSNDNRALVRRVAVLAVESRESRWDVDGGPSSSASSISPTAESPKRIHTALLSKAMKRLR